MKYLPDPIQEHIPSTDLHTCRLVIQAFQDLIGLQYQSCMHLDVEWYKCITRRFILSMILPLDPVSSICVLDAARLLHWLDTRNAILLKSSLPSLPYSKCERLVLWLAFLGLP
jgi:hypothetical protein